MIPIVPPSEQKLIEQAAISSLEALQILAREIAEAESELTQLD